LKASGCTGRLRGGQGRPGEAGGRTPSAPAGRAQEARSAFPWSSAPHRRAPNCDRRAEEEGPGGSRAQQHGSPRPWQQSVWALPSAQAHAWCPVLSQSCPPQRRVGLLGLRLRVLVLPWHFLLSSLLLVLLLGCPVVVLSVTAAGGVGVGAVCHRSHYARCCC
jgi:hypothetical protein